MSKNKNIYIDTHLGEMFFVILIILVVGEPDLLDAIIAWVGRL